MATILINYQPSEQYLLIEGIDCQHEDVEYEDFVTDYMSFDGHNQWESTERVCRVCGDILEPIEPDYYEGDR